MTITLPGLLILDWYALFAASCVYLWLCSSLCHRLVRRWL